jgi:G6PDH family F420-dependent oxidoreductase
VHNAGRAEAAGFEFLSISDHYHPWVQTQGHSSFVWGVLGAVAQSTSDVAVGVGVTCPILRLHPAVVAQAAATASLLFEGRFFLGVGTGEALNEHIVGEHWPPLSVRQEMLREAVEVIRELWRGEYVTHHGDFYTVENAKIYTLPSELPSIAVAASGEDSAKLAGEIGDAFISTAPKAELVRAYQASGGSGPTYGQMTVCWAADKAEAVRTAKEIWGYTAVPGQLSQELSIPKYFDEVASIVTEVMVEQAIVCGPDPEPYRQQIDDYAKAGFSHVYIHQIGPDQAGFFDFAKRELLP